MVMARMLLGEMLWGCKLYALRISMKKSLGGSENPRSTNAFVSTHSPASRAGIRAPGTVRRDPG
jgi:hypothetical protein